MGKERNSDRLDPDIAECKQDILRAGGANAGGDSKGRSVARAQNKTKSGGLIIKSDEASGKKQQQTSQVPRFDLAEDIMAQQRKLIALRRKAPQKNAETRMRQEGLPSGSDIAARLNLNDTGQQQIIAEIVARDIDRMCRGGYSHKSG